MLVTTPLKVVLVDINPSVISAWKAAFSDLPEVQLVQGSILDQKVDAWVSPTNAQGNMDGGVDAVIKQHLGAGIEKKVQKQIETQYNRHMPVGCAVCVPTGKDVPKFLISTPTMVRSSENIGDTTNVALACAAAFQMIHMHNKRGQGLITSVAIPGLGVGTGQVPVRICANLMWTAYTLYNEHEFADFMAMRAAVQEQVGGVKKWDEQTRVRVVPPS